MQSDFKFHLTEPLTTLLQKNIYVLQLVANEQVVDLHRATYKCDVRILEQTG